MKTILLIVLFLLLLAAFAGWFGDDTANSTRIRPTGHAPGYDRKKG